MAKALFGHVGSAPDRRLVDEVTVLRAKVRALEFELTNPEIKADEDDLNYEPRLDHDWVALAAVVASADRKPLASSVRYYDILKSKQDAVLARWKILLEGDVAEFSRAAEETKLPRVSSAPKIEKM